MSGLFRIRNFDTIKVGKSYIADFTDNLVKIVKNEKDTFIGDNNVEYTKTGKVKRNNTNSKLIAEGSLGWFADLVVQK
jgi:hypothetical protein